MLINLGNIRTVKKIFKIPCLQLYTCLLCIMSCLLHIFNNVCICIHNIYIIGFILIRFLEVYIQYKSMTILVAKKCIPFQELETYRYVNTCRDRINPMFSLLHTDSTEFIGYIRVPVCPFIGIGSPHLLPPKTQRGEQHPLADEGVGYQ
jgi:hypothetical protein